jgi:hypothetical protein
MRNHPRTSNTAVIDEQVLLALCDTECTSRKEAICLKGAAGQVLAVAAVTEVLEGGEAGDGKVDAVAEATTSVDAGW